MYGSLKYGYFDNLIFLKILLSRIKELEKKVLNYYAKIWLLELEFNRMSVEILNEVNHF